ncbi:MAG TPA: GlsB/YeaQ/YmgE family stress response membrane protein [Armatimonadota bacterium]
MGILSWIIFGGIAGWIASALTGQREGCLGEIAIGIVGALIGGFIFSVLGGVGVTGFNLWSIVVAVLGAVILIVIIRAIRRQA